jgi:hypothetical protein
MEPNGEMSVVSVVAARMKLGRSFYLEERRDDVAVETYWILKRLLAPATAMPRRRSNV